MASNIKKNFFYNASYQVLSLILPLMTAPYVSRIMGAKNIGIYSYSYSVASYFGLFILLGINNYGNRTIAGVKNNKEKLSQTFCSIYAMQLIMAVLIVSLYIIYIIFLSEEKTMALIQMIYLFSVMFDINWFFFGMEMFKMTVTRNVILRILNLICLFLFVKKPDDIYIYALIMVIGSLFGQLISWPFVTKYIKIIKVDFNDIKQHIIPNLTLFIPVIAISLYTIMDKVMLGAMSSMTEVGYYESSNKLTVVPAMAVTSLGTVMLPRISNLIANGKNEEAKVYIQKSLIISILLSSSMAFGLSAISKEFVPIFYGEGFEKCIYIISILVLSSIFLSWANVIRTQYLIPNKEDKIYIISVFLGAVVNIAINLLLIPQLQAIGAAIGTICAEFTVCAYQTYKVRNKIKVFIYFKQSFPLLLSSIIMYFIVINIPSLYNDLITLVIKIVVGVIIYIVFAGIYYIWRLKSIFKNK